MNRKELIAYEMPLLAEFVSWDWLQTIIAKHVARTVERKLYRLEKRKFRAEWIKRHLATLDKKAE